MSHRYLQSVQNNGSLWADIFLVKDGASPDPSKPNFDIRAIHHVRKCALDEHPQCTGFSRTSVLTRYLPKTKIRKVKSLLGGSNEDEHDEPEESLVVLFKRLRCSIINCPLGQHHCIALASCESCTPIHELLVHVVQNLTLALISDAAVLPVSKLPEPVARRMSSVLCEILLLPISFQTSSSTPKATNRAPKYTTSPSYSLTTSGCSARSSPRSTVRRLSCPFRSPSSP